MHMYAYACEARKPQVLFLRPQLPKLLCFFEGCVCIPKYISITSSVHLALCVCLYDITHTYDFWANYLVPDDQLGVQSLGKTLSPSSASLSCCGSLYTGKAL